MTAEVPSAVDLQMRRWDWDGVSDYVSPVAAGDRVVLTRGSTVITGRVAQVAGYAPGVVEVEGGVRVDLADGWLFGVVS